MDPEFACVGVVGCGLMGSGIAEVAARAGADVVVVDASKSVANDGLGRIAASMTAAVARNKLDQRDADLALARIRLGDDVQALAECDLVIEAVPEIESEKLRVFHDLDGAIRRPETVFATNTSSIPVMKLAMATRRPDRVVGLHFFNPVPVLPLVELVGSLLTSEDTLEAVARYAGDVLNKHVIRSQDRAGFIVNALLIPYLLSAIRMLESGFASAADIDRGMVDGCAHPMGPLALADLIGLDTTMAVSLSLYDEFKEPLYAPPPLLSRMVEAGLLGRKSRRGFYEYSA